MAGDLYGTSRSSQTIYVNDTKECRKIKTAFLYPLKLYKDISKQRGGEGGKERERERFYQSLQQLFKLGLSTFYMRTPELSKVKQLTPGQ